MLRLQDAVRCVCRQIEAFCRPKFGALSWKTCNMRETNVEFDAAEIHARGGGGYSLKSTHAD